MVQPEHGDIVNARAEALVNTVNCVGIMGRGIALHFRQTFPENYKAYKAACARGKVQPGTMFVTELHQLGNPRYVINFPTKRHWREKSKIEDIAAGLEALVAEVRARNIRSVAVPPLGCGLGGLDWSRVRPMIERAFSALPDVSVLLFAPSGVPAAATAHTTAKTPEMTVGRAVLLALMKRYLCAVMDPFISLLEIHKLLYFMQEAGELLQLRFQKALYGPYAENLRHLLSHIEGHFISGFGDAGDHPDKQIELVGTVADQADAFIAAHAQTQKRFERVVKLIEGFETPFGMELLATVHWVACHEDATTVDDAITKIYAWNKRKAMFSEGQIRVAWNALRNGAWIQAA